MKNSFSPCSALLLASLLALHSGSILVLAFFSAFLRLFATNPKAELAEILLQPKPVTVVLFLQSCPGNVPPTAWTEMGELVQLRL